MTEKIAHLLFDLDPDIRYVAVNQGGKIIEMEQSLKWPSLNATETDRMEELIVNPTILELARRRGEIDLGGIRYIVIRYGPLYQLLFPYKDGHISVGIERSADITAVAHKIAGRLDIRV